jgi:hypothetical protein
MKNAMPRLSPKEVDLVREAILGFGSAGDIEAWSIWLRSNPQAPNEQTFPPLSLETARRVVNVLRSYNRSAVSRIKNGGHGEDETADLGNDLTVTDAVLSDISRDWD